MVYFVFMVVFLESWWNNLSINFLDFYFGFLLISLVYCDLCEDFVFFSILLVFVVVVFCYVVLILLIVLGNGFVIVVFVINGWLRIVMSFFIVGFVISDLFVGIFVVFFWMFVVLYDNIMVGYCFLIYVVYISFDIFVGCVFIL